MGKDVHLNIAGVWKTIDACNVNIGGVWKDVDVVWVNIAGTWKEAWRGTVYNLDGQPIELADAPGPILTGVRINTDGTVDQHTDDNTTDHYVQIDSATDWIIPNGAATSSYWVRATEVAQTGGGTLTGTLATWLQLTGNREWSIERQAVSGAGTSTWDLTIEIATDSGGSNIVASGLYEMTSTISP